MGLKITVSKEMEFRSHISAARRHALRVRPSHEPPLPVLAPSPYPLNLSVHRLDLLHRIKTVIDRNRALAKDLGISWTPGFVVGAKLVHGALNVNSLNDLVA